MDKGLINKKQREILSYLKKEILEKAERPVPFKRKGTGALLVAAGRLTRQKGFDRLIEACRLLRDKGYSFELWILGEGPERRSLEELIQKYRLDDRISLLGFVENPYPCINKADILVCSSRYEGMSTVVTEGLILGKAIVTTACTGMDELLGESGCGVIVEDSITGLVSGIQKLLDSKQLRSYYSELAKKYGKKFSLDNSVENTMCFLESVFRENNR